MRQRYNLEPRTIAARYACRCPETGREIKKGDACVWYPAARKCYHVDSRAARQFREMTSLY